MNFLKNFSKSIKKQLTQPLCDESEKENSGVSQPGVLSFYQSFSCPSHTMNGMDSKLLIKNNVGVISSKFINKLVQKCQCYYTFLDSSIYIKLIKVKRVFFSVSH